MLCALLSLMLSSAVPQQAVTIDLSSDKALVSALGSMPLTHARPELVFLDDARLVVVFEVPPDKIVVPDDRLNRTYRAVFVSLGDKRILNQLEWQSRRNSYQIAPLENGRFALIADDTVSIYSADFKKQEEHTLADDSRSRDDGPGKWKLYSSADVGYVFVDSGRKDDIVYSADPKTFKLTPIITLHNTEVHDVKNGNIAYLEFPDDPGGPKHMGIVQFPEGPQPVCTDCGSSAHLVKSAPMQLVISSGSEVKLYDLSPPREVGRLKMRGIMYGKGSKSNFVIGSTYGRPAMTLYKLDLAQKLKPTKVAEVPTWRFNTQYSGFRVASEIQPVFSLSPSGHSLAVMNSAAVTVYSLD